MLDFGHGEKAKYHTIIMLSKYSSQINILKRNMFKAINCNLQNYQNWSAFTWKLFQQTIA